VLEVASENVDAVAEMAKERGLKCEAIGSVGGDKVKLNDVEMPMEQLNDLYFNTFKRIIEQDI